MRYSLMAIPLNDFSIQSGSYVEFTGNISNPVLGISASERVKAIVTENDVPRNVAFDVGLSLSQTLEDMGLTFTLEAPEDMTVQNELTAMSTEYPAAVKKPSQGEKTTKTTPADNTLQRMVDREAKRAEGKGVGYDRWAANWLKSTLSREAT